MMHTTHQAIEADGFNIRTYFSGWCFGGILYFLSKQGMSCVFCVFTVMNEQFRAFLPKSENYRAVTMQI